MTTHPRHWRLEDLLDRPAQRGQAEADARFHGNESARTALNELHSAVRGLADPDDGDDAA